MVHLNYRFHKSIRLYQTFGFVVFTQHYGVELAYVEILQRLYSHKEGTVLTDKASDMFPIKRERSREALSSFTLQHSVAIFLEDDLKRWHEKQKGIGLSDKKKTA